MQDTFTVKVEHPAAFRIEFPALEALVAYWRERDQRKSDATAETIQKLAARLKAAREPLQAAVEKEKENE
jgi:hypothetical protein